MADATEKILFVKCIFSDLPMRHALALAKNGNFTKRSKHIDITLHFVHDLVVNGKIDVVNGDNNIADTLTNPLGRIKFIELRKRLHVYYDFD